MKSNDDPCLVFAGQLFAGAEEKYIMKYDFSTVNYITNSMRDHPLHNVKCTPAIVAYPGWLIFYFLNPIWYHQVT